MAKFKTIITTVGAAKIAAVLAGTASIILDNTAKMAVGDGGGTLPTPTPAQTKLVNEVHRAPINRASIDASDPKNIVAELVIPPETGGFWVREMALYDAAGTLLAVGNMAETYKPSLSEGAGRKMVIRMVIAVSEINAITITMDTSTVMATQDYVDSEIDKHAKSRNHPDATLTAKGFTQLSSSTTSASETLAATPKAVKTVMDATNLKAPLASPALTGTPTAPTAAQTVSNAQIATTAYVKAAIDALINSSPGALDTLSELAAALGNDPNFATTMVNALAAKAPLASPVLTGTPTAPTAAQTVSNAQIATTAYVKAAIDALVNSSPGALDTLSELAAALGNDPNFATTMVNALAAKAPLANPALAGKPTAPTAAQSSNDTQIATTEFVTRAVAPAFLVRGGIPASANLNNFGPTSAYTGVWGQSSVSATAADIANGYPAAERGVLEVFAGGRSNGTQRYTTDAGRIFTRWLTAAWNAASPSWSDWWEVGGLSSNTVLPTTVTTLSDATYFAQNQTYVLSGARADSPVGVSATTAIIMSVRRAGNTTMGLHQTLFTAVGTYERYGAPNAATGWTSVSWYNGGDAYGWRLVGADALASLGLGLTTQPAIAVFDWQQADFVSGSQQVFSFSASVNAPAGITFNTGTTVTLEVIQTRGTQYTLRLTGHTGSSGNRREYLIFSDGNKGSRGFQVNQKFNSDTSTVIPIANGGLGANTPEGGRKNLGFEDMGIGLSNQAALASFDWQQADFVTGAIYLSSTSTWTNAPSGVSYLANTQVFIHVDGITSSGTGIEVTLSPNTTADTNFKIYKVRIGGAKGSRVFSVRQVLSNTDEISGRLLNVAKFTASGTYTPTPGTKSIIVEAIGAGGASGNLVATTSSTNAISAAGGNGTYAKARYTTGFSGVAVTIGAGGIVNGGGGGGGNGGDGGATTFGSLLTCPGGKGSVVGTPIVPPVNVNIPAAAADATGSGIIIAAKGLLPAVPVAVALGNISNFANLQTTLMGSFGRGGDGRASNTDATAQSGNAGAPGCVIIWEYA